MVTFPRILVAVATAVGFILGVLSDELRSSAVSATDLASGTSVYTIGVVISGFIAALPALISGKNDLVSQLKSYFILVVSGVASALAQELHNLLKNIYVFTMLAITGLLAVTAASIVPGSQRVPSTDLQRESTGGLINRAAERKPMVQRERTPVESTQLQNSYTSPKIRPLMSVVIALISIVLSTYSLGPLMFFLFVPKVQIAAGILLVVLLLNLLGGVGFLLNRRWGWHLLRASYVVNIAYLLVPGFFFSSSQPAVQYLYVGLCVAVVFYLNSKGVVSSLSTKMR
jgi:hypothetical protein